MSEYIKRGSFGSILSRKIKTGYKDILDYAADPSNGLDIQLRGNYLNIYYKGGNILRLKPQSLFLDEFYFYETPLEKRKTHVLDGAKQGVEEDVERLRIIREKRDMLLRLLDEGKVNLYFQSAKEQMDKWSTILKDQLEITHDEKERQHDISLKNRTLSDSDYVVIDLEYAVSLNLPFNELGHPRFDIIAVENATQQLCVIELKDKLGAIDGPSGVDDHNYKFNQTIGKDKSGLFLKEMMGLLKKKQELGILDRNITINEKLPPKFMLAFAGNQSQKLEFMRRFGSKYEIILLDDTNKLIKI